MSNPVDPQTGDPEAPDPPGDPEPPVEPTERADTAGIVVEVDDGGDGEDEGEDEVEVAEVSESGDGEGGDGGDGEGGEGEAGEVEEAEPDPVVELEAQLLAAQRQARENYDRLVRSAADLDNFRKRARRDINDSEIMGKTIVLREILPVVDNLERAVDAAGDAAETKGIREGIELVLRQFVQTLEKLSVLKVPALGKPFDPNVHEAVGQRPTADVPPGTVVEVLQPGYTLSDRLLRAALCVVASAPPEPPPEAEPEEEPEEPADSEEPESEPEPEISAVPGPVDDGEETEPTED